MEDFSIYAFKHKTHIQIRFNDIDMLRHVNNAVYQNYFDSGRFRYFKDVLKVDKFKDNNFFVIASIQIDYIQPIELNDKITVETKIIRTGNKSLTMLQQIILHRDETSFISTRSSSVLVSYDIVQNKSIQVPKDWVEKIEAYENH